MRYGQITFRTCYMSMDRKTLDDFFRGYLTGRQRDEVLEWIESKGESWVDNYMQEHWDRLEFAAGAEQKRLMQEKVLQSIHSQQVPVRWMRILKIAAVFLLAAAGLWWWKYAAQPVQPEWHIVNNEGKGHIMLRDTLPDGTIVTLNEHSGIRYANTYNKKDRVVILTGEAFFDVQHDRERPFIVKAGHAFTKVYGTAFTVTAYPASGQLRVGLQRGSIGVTYDTLHTGQEKMLVPGQLLIYNKSSNTVSIENQAPEKLGAWTTGKLVFFKTPVNDVLSQLEQRYDVHFRYDHNIGNRTVTATFDNVPLQKVLQHISFVWNIRFEQRGDSIDVK